MKSQGKKSRIPAVLFTLGIINILMGILLLTFVRGEETAKLRRCTEQVPGTVTAVEKRTTTRYDNTYEDINRRRQTETTYAVTVSWSIQGVPFKATQNWSSPIPEGTEYTVWYNPNDAAEFYIEDFSATPEGSALMGAIYLLIGAGMFAGGWLLRKRAQIRAASAAP